VPAECFGWSKKTTGASEQYATILGPCVAQAGQHLFGSATVAGSQKASAISATPAARRAEAWGCSSQTPNHTFQVGYGVVNATQTKFKKPKPSTQCVRRSLRRDGTEVPDADTQGYETGIKV
jgi:hypothetical protein